MFQPKRHRVLKKRGGVCYGIRKPPPSIFHSKRAYFDITPLNIFQKAFAILEFVVLLHQEFYGHQKCHTKFPQDRKETTLSLTINFNHYE